MKKPYISKSSQRHRILVHEKLFDVRVQYIPILTSYILFSYLLIYSALPETLIALISESIVKHR